MKITKIIFTFFLSVLFNCTLFSRNLNNSITFTSNEIKCQNSLNYCNQNRKISSEVDDNNSFILNAECMNKLQKETLSSCRVNDSLELVKFFISHGGQNWDNKDNWLVRGKPIHTWRGVFTGLNGCVTEIWLEYNYLSGNMYNYNFPELKILNLSNNNLTGSIPNFNKLLNLDYLNLGYNKLTSNIPNFGNLLKLQNLDLSDNQLTGNIPNFDNIPNLFYLDLEYNQLTGNIPNFDNLLKLEGLWVNNNRLSGIIPDFNKLPKLNVLRLDNNQFEGTIPVLDNLLNLVGLYANNNLLSGPIPKFDKLLLLEELDLSNNQLTDTIPNFNNLPNLVWIQLSNNKFSGCIPQKFKIWCAKNFFDFSNNALLPWQGDKDNFCKYWNLQIFSPCNDLDSTTINDKIDRNCNCVGTKAPQSCRAHDSLELIKLFDSLGGPNWTNKTNWKVSGKPINTWYGITLNSNGCVSEINLNTNNLKGNIYNFDFPEIKDLDLHYNQLTGSIPIFDKLPNLLYLRFDNNKLTGLIPNFDKLPNLVRLFLSSNQLTGPIPNFDKLPNLSLLFLFYNQLSGPIPNFDKLPNLYSMDLSNNQLSGSIPNFDKVPALLILYLSSNQLTGCFSSSLKRLCGITYDFTNNPKLPWQGDFKKFCQDSSQVGASCDDMNATTINDKIDANCNCVGTKAPQSCRAHDSLELIKLFDSLGGPNWINKTNWKVPGKPIDTWYGITLNSNGCVLSIDLSRNNLSGKIFSFEFFDIVNFFLTNNKLTGSIPDFNNLPNLLHLKLDANQLTGSVPNFTKLTNLKYLYLQFNQLTGIIPNFDKLTYLNQLFLHYNQLTGSIPNFNKLPNLAQLYLCNNQLTGSIPNFDNLPSIWQLLLFNNQLTGLVPNFDKLPNLTQLYLYNNQLTGSIPNFDKLPRLFYLWLNSNQLTGSIPNFDKLPNLLDLNLQNNQLSGPVPNFDKLPALSSLILSNNQLSGCFSTSLKKHCGITYDFKNNPKLPWQGDFLKFCQDSSQIGAPCNDLDSTTINDKIDANCNCTGKNSSFCDANPLNKGLVAYYPLNGNANDASGNGNNGNITNITWVTDRFGSMGQAAQFGGCGNESVIHVPNNPSLQFKSGFSFSAFIKTASSSGAMNGFGSCDPGVGGGILFSKDFDFGNGMVFFSWNYPSNTEYNFTNENYQGENKFLIRSRTDADDKEWVHIAITLDSTNLRIYKNGKLLSDSIITDPLDFSKANRKDLFIGRFANKWYPYGGIMDDIRFYNRGLSSSEVQQLYGSNSPICTSSKLQLFSADAALSYSWKGPNAFVSSQQNPTIANLTSSNIGAYQVVSDFGVCKDTARIWVEFDSSVICSPWPIVCKGGNIHYVALDYKKLESSSFGTTNTPLEKGDWIGIFYRKKDGSYVCTDAQVVGDLTQSGGLQLKACGETSPGADDGFESNEPLYYQVLKGQTTYYANELITSYHERFSLNNGTYPDGYDKFEGGQLISLIKSIRTVDLSSNPDCNAPILLRCGDKLRNQDNRRGTNNTIVYNCIRNKVDGPELIFTFIHADKKDVRIVIDNLQNSGSSDLELFLMDKCDKDHCIAYSAKTGSSPESLIVRDLPAGTYYIIVDGYFGSESTFDISIECGDFPDDDYSVPGGGSGSGGPVINPKNCGDNFTDNTLNGERKKSSYSPCTNRYYPGREKIYTINFNKKGYVYLYVTPIDNDVDVFILDKYAANSCIAESTQSGLEEELVTFPVEANKNYYVIVDEFATDKGCNFKLRYDCYMTSSGGGGGGTSAPCYAKCDTMPKLDCGVEYQGNTALGKACKTHWYPCRKQGAKGNPGKEVIYLFENKTTQDVIFNVYDLKEDLNVYILDTCVGTCYEDWNTKKTGASAEAFIIQAMPPGIYNVIIDTYVSGKESTFKIRLDCSKTSNPCFDIKVPKGLSYISSPIKPTDPAIDFLLPDAKFNGKIDVITNDKMISYAPGFTSLPSSSALSKWSVEDGYKVLSSEASVINVCGELADSAKIKSVIAKEAKGKLFQHYISYPFMYKQNVVTAFGDSAKSFASQVIKFFPDNAQPPLSYNFNSKLGDNFEMEPGIGYVLKVNRDGNFSYRTKEKEYVPNGCDYFKTELRETSSHAWIKIPKYAIQQAIIIGSEVGVFTNTGLLVGSGKYEGENLLITIQGNNVNTNDVEGFNPNEPINLKFYDVESKTEKEMHVIWKTSNLFQENTVFEISLVTMLESNSAEGIQIYPNPAKDLVYIDLRSVNGKVESLSLFNSKGVKLEELKHINQKQIIEYQCNSCPSGIYYIQVNTNQSSSTKKLILIK